MNTSEFSKDEKTFMFEILSQTSISGGHPNYRAVTTLLASCMEKLATVIGVPPTKEQKPKPLASAAQKPRKR